MTQTHLDFAELEDATTYKLPPVVRDGRMVERSVTSNGTEWHYFEDGALVARGVEYKDVWPAIKDAHSCGKVG